MPQKNKEIPDIPDVPPKKNDVAKDVADKARNARGKLRKEIRNMDKKSKEKLKKAFSYMEKENFDKDKVREMLGISKNMSVYDLWRGGIARMKNEKGLKENQGFNRMTAQFANRKVDKNGRDYLEVNLHNKNKFEMNIGAGHICPPSWKKVAIVDLDGNVRVGERKVPGKDNVRGGKIGYFDDQGEYLVIFSGYKVYPLSVLSNNEKNDKKIIDEQTEKESTFYRENKEEIMDYIVESTSYTVRQSTMSKVEIQRIRNQIPGLEEIQDPGKRVELVAKWITENDKIYAKHCGDWVKRVYEIAGVKSNKIPYVNIPRDENGEIVHGSRAYKWTDAIKDNPKLVANLKPGAHLWIYNGNTVSRTGLHSVIFLGWKDKARKIAFCANWLSANPKGQKISTYDFKKYPISRIKIPTEVEEKFERFTPKESARVEHEQLHINEANKQELIKRGSMPFEVRVGYKLTPEEYEWYQGTRREGRRLGKMTFNQRWDILEERYNLRHAVNYAAEMLGISQANFKMFFAFNDAILRTESNYNPFCINTVRDGNTLRCARSTAAGEYQIVHGTWGKGRTRRVFFGDSSNADRNRRGLSKIGIKPELVAKINLDSPRAEFATPYQRAIFFNFYFVRYSRAISQLESIDDIFDNIRSTEGRMRDSWIRVMYTYWRNGPGGAQALVRNLRQNIPLPRTINEAREYFQNHLQDSDWQKKRGFRDFWNLMKATNVFKRRFNKNMSEI